MLTTFGGKTIMDLNYEYFLCTVQYIQRIFISTTFLQFKTPWGTHGTGGMIYRHAHAAYMALNVLRNGKANTSLDRRRILWVIHSAT